MVILGKCLSDALKSIVVACYEDSQNSSMMAGKKDFVSIRRADGKRENVQKKLVLFNLVKVYDKFLEEV